MKYCPRCRCELQPRSFEGRSRPACPSSGCGFIHWNNPIPVVAGLVQWRDGYLLARNSAWPPAVFSLLTGFIDEGEAPEVAVVREITEEIGVKTQSIDFIGHFPLPRFNQLIIAYCLRTKGELVLGDEIAEVKLVEETELAKFDFGSLELTREIVSRWLRRSVASSAEQVLPGDAFKATRA